MLTNQDLFDVLPKSKSNGHNGPHLASNGHTIVCRIIGIREAELLKILGIHNAAGMTRSAWRRLSRKHPDLKPADIAKAIREVRPMGELWLDAVATGVENLKPLGRRPANRRRRRRFVWRQPWPTKRPQVPTTSTTL